MAAPNPDCEASHVIVTGLVTSKYESTGCLDKTLSPCEMLFLVAPSIQNTSDFSKSRIGLVMVDILGMNFAK